MPNGAWQLQGKEGAATEGAEIEFETALILQTD